MVKTGTSRFIAVMIMATMLLVCVTPFMGESNDGGFAASEHKELPDGYVGISTAEELQAINDNWDDAENPSSAGKYMLMADIDFTGAEPLSPYEMTVTVTVGASETEFSLSYKNADGEEVQMTNNWLHFGKGEADFDGNTSVQIPHENSGFVKGVPMTFLIGGSTADHFDFVVAREITDSITFTTSPTGNFEPLGVAGQTTGVDQFPFTGVFDGNGYKIIGMETVTYTEEYRIFSGMFRAVSGDAVLRNIVLEGGSSFGYGNFFIQGSAAQVAHSFVGAIVGQVVASTDGSVTIENCYSSSAVIAGSHRAQSMVGGIFGMSTHMQGTTVTGFNLLVSNCTNEGKVSSFSCGGPIGGSSTASYAGGIAGFPESSNVSVKSFEGCYNNGNISSYLIGGFGGDMTFTHAGGIVGAIRFFSSPYFEITDCINDGNVIAMADESSSRAEAGGIFGVADMDDWRYDGITSTVIVTNCGNNGDVTAIADRPSMQAFEPEAKAGGITGGIRSYSDFISEPCTMLISQCYNTGKITAIVPYEGNVPGSEAESHAGGIATFTDSGGTCIMTFTDCYNVGNISIEGRTGSSSAGGILGRDGSQANVSIVNCYSTAKFTANEDGPLCYGILNPFLNVNLVVNSSYYLDDESITGGWGDGGLIDGVDDLGDVASGSRSIDQLKDIAYFNTETQIGDFEPWDFEEVWAFTSDNNGLPHFVWQEFDQDDDDDGESAGEKFMLYFGALLLGSAAVGAVVAFVVRP